jgi:hypothetical protein
MPSRAFQQASIISSDGALTGVTVTPSQISDQANTSTGYIDLPSGTTAQRPVSTTSGSVRYNTTLATVEVYNGTSWLPVGTVYDAESSSTGFFDLPSGTTAQRPVTPSVGMMRYNSTTGFAEVYTQAGWGIFGALPPSINSVTPVTFNGEQGTPFTINGSNFTNDATVSFITNANIEYAASTVTFVSSGQIIATTPRDFTVAEEPLDVKVVQSSGTTTAIDVIDCGGVPSWSTSAGSLGTIYDSNRSTYSTTVLATDLDSGATISYSVSSGALPTGMSINSSTGTISGTANAVVSDTTYNFSITATDNANNTSTRSFSLLVKAPITTVFSYTGADQTWTVPAGLTSASIKIWGAGGGGSNSGDAAGGSGGYATGTWSVIAGTVYKIVVGQGGDGGGTIGGGGGGGGLSGIFSTSTTVFTGATPTSGIQSNSLLIAGGGGGAAGGNGDNNATYGGAGGGTTGGTGRADTRGGNPAGAGTLNGGGGGTQSAGGSAAPDTGGGYGNPDAGTALRGGDAAAPGGRRSARYGGGGAGSNAYGGSYGGGGGGGGYYGGGGGQDYYSSGGGGGSGYIGAGMTATLTAGNSVTTGNATAPNAASASSTGIGLGGGSNTAGGNGEVRISY